ncbi:MAG: galactitol 2-dehydrogenase [Solirubrobacteraceae bacterium]|nr:galactitol 2-dehydrogenase [Solirubrobacteraceae bacterium]
MAGLLEGKVAAVTGASRSIGLAVAHRYAEEGASVVLADIDQAGAAAAAAEFAAAGLRATAVHVDVTNAASVDAAVQACVDAYGRVDVAVANAGVLHLAPLTETEPAAWQRVIDVNLTGVFLTLRAFARQLIDQGGGGSLIATSSLFGIRGGRENVAYAATKFGVVGLVQCAAADLAPHGITVNAVAPGQVVTPMGEQLVADKARLRGLPPQQIQDEIDARIPLGRMARVEEIADGFVYLASPLGRYVTGTTQLVDGGWMVG